MTVNGKPVVSAATTLEALLTEIGVVGQRIAVERNRELVPRRLWPQTAVGADDQIEIVHFVGGGCGVY